MLILASVVRWKGSVCSTDQDPVSGAQGYDEECDESPTRALWVCSMTRLSADKTTALLVYFRHVFFFFLFGARRRMRCFDGDKNHRHEFKLILNSDSVLLLCKCLHVKRILHYVYHPLINKSCFFFFFIPSVPLESSCYGIKFFIFQNFTATKW